MNQKRIKSLLEELSLPTTDSGRFLAIHSGLRQEIWKPDPSYEEAKHAENRSAGFKLVFDDLLMSSKENNRNDILPMLFPVVALLCGDRDEHSVFADIDWSLVDPPKA